MMPVSTDQKASDELRDAQPVGASGDLGRPGDDLGRVADRVRTRRRSRRCCPGSATGCTGTGTRLSVTTMTWIGVDRVGEREAQRSARRRSVGAVGVAEGVGRRRGDDGDVDVDLAVLDRLPAAAVGPQHAETAHLAVGAVVAQRAVHAALDVVHHARVHQIDHRRVAGERGAGEPHQILGARARPRPRAPAPRRRSPLRRWWCVEITMPSRSPQRSKACPPGSTRACRRRRVGRAGADGRSRACGPVGRCRPRPGTGSARGR